MAGDTAMAWKTPKIIEIALGAEINSYASADLK
jgi:coenzyme PQQ precursor peptide PqqA